MTQRLHLRQHGAQRLARVGVDRRHGGLEDPQRLLDARRVGRHRVVDPALERAGIVARIEPPPVRPDVADGFHPFARPRRHGLHPPQQVLDGEGLAQEFVHAGVAGADDRRCRRLAAEHDDRRLAAAQFAAPQGARERRAVEVGALVDEDKMRLDRAGQRQPALRVLRCPDLAGGDVAQQLGQHLRRRRVRIDNQDALHQRGDALLRPRVQAHNHDHLRLARESRNRPQLW
jgi:hypothetical protein